MKRGPVLGLVPLGPVDPEILRYLVKTLAEFLPVSVQLLAPKHLPMQTYHVGRDQNHSTQLLEFLLDDAQLENFQILGITAVDLYIPIFTFVFGEAQLDGRAAIISTFRPGGGADGFQPPKRTFLSRLLKLSLHELGHSFGLGHCHQPGCLMGFSANLEKLDQKNQAFCQYCQIMLNDYFDRFNESRSLNPS
jgi:archaemetzincin